LIGVLTVHILAAAVAAGGVLLLVRHGAAAERVGKQRLIASKVPRMHGALLRCGVIGGSTPGSLKEGQAQCTLSSAGCRVRWQLGV
jgi:hypothetical protein